MKKCKTCGKELKSNEKYCTNCGQEYKIIDINPENEFVIKDPNKKMKQKIKTNEPQNITSTKIIAIAICLISCIIPIISEYYEEENEIINDNIINDEELEEIIDDETYSFNDEIDFENSYIKIYNPSSIVINGKKTYTFFIYLNNFYSNEEMTFDLNTLTFNTDKNIYKYEDENKQSIIVNSDATKTDSFKLTVDIDEELKSLTFLYNDNTYTITKD